MGNWIYGCDICQEVCPFNRFAALTDEAGFYPEDLRLKSRDWHVVAPPLLEILALDEAGFQERFAHSPIKRIKRNRLVRNACVAAGNWGMKPPFPCLLRSSRIPTRSFEVMRPGLYTRLALMLRKRPLRKP